LGGGPRGKKRANQKPNGPEPKVSLYLAFVRDPDGEKKRGGGISEMKTRDQDQCGDAKEGGHRPRNPPPNGRVVIPPRKGKRGGVGKGQSARSPVSHSAIGINQGAFLCEGKKKKAGITVSHLAKLRMSTDCKKLQPIQGPTFFSCRLIQYPVLVKGVVSKKKNGEGGSKGKKKGGRIPWPAEKPKSRVGRSTSCSAAHTCGAGELTHH